MHPDSSGMLARGGAIMLAAAGAQSLGNLAFHAVTTRAVGPAQYGALGALLALMLALAVPLASVQFAVTRAVAEVGEQADVRRVLRQALLVALLLVVAGLLLSPLIVRFLRLADSSLAVAVGPYVGLAVLGAVARGVLVARARVALVAASLAVAVAIRLLLGIALVPSFGIGAALFATVVGELAGTAAVWFAVSGRGALPVRLGLRDVVGATTVLAGLWLFVNVDVLLVRRLLAPVEAGMYVAAANAARALLIIPQAILVAYLPAFVRTRRSHVRGASDGVGVAGPLTVVAVLTALAGGVMVAIDAPALRLLYGSAFVPAAPLLLPIVLSTIAAALVTVVTHRDLAQRSRFAYLSWAGVGLEVVVLSFAVGSGSARLAQAMLIASAVHAAFVLFLVPALRRKRSREASFVAGDLYAPLPPSAELTVVVPFIDETDRAEQNIRQLIEAVRKEVSGLDVVAVSDAPSSAVDASTLSASGAGVRVFHLPHTCGKGAAVRFGISQARGRYIAFIDGDGDIPFAQLVTYVRMMRALEPEILYASKRHPLSEVVRPSGRSLATLALRILAGGLAAVRVRDTQCGLKLLRREVAQAVVPWLEVPGFAFDVELFAVAHRLGFHRFLEAPVTIVTRRRSTVTLRASAKMLLDLLRMPGRVRRIPRTAARKIPAVTAPLPRDLRDAVTTARLRPLRILILTWRDRFHPAAGGAEIYITQVARWWARWGHHVTTFSATDPGRPGEERWDGVTHIRRGGRFTVYREARKYLAGNRGDFDLVIDVVNTRPFGAPQYAGDVPVVALAHQVAREVWFYEFPWPLAWLGSHLLEPLWLRQYRRVPTLTVSPSSRDSLAAYGLRRLRVVPEGVELPSGIPIADRTEDGPTLVFCGRLVRSKRPGDAIEAMGIVRRELPEVELLVIGGGPLLESLELSAPEGVRFLGVLSEREKFETMARADALVATSVREGWGLVVSEAASVGTPSVAYDVAGLRDSVSAAGGVLCDPNPAALARTLLEVLPRWRHRPPILDARGGTVEWRQVAAEVLAAAIVDGGVVVHEQRSGASELSEHATDPAPDPSIATAGAHR